MSGSFFLQPGNAFIDRLGDVAAEDTRARHGIFTAFGKMGSSPSRFAFSIVSLKSVWARAVYSGIVRRELLALVSDGGNDVDEDSRHYCDRDAEDSNHRHGAGQAAVFQPLDERLEQIGQDGRNGDRNQHGLKVRNRADDEPSKERRHSAHRYK